MSSSVLVIDDDATFRLVSAQILKKAGFSVIQAADGESGLTAAFEHRPAVILLDWMMPGMDGPEACQRIRRNPELSNSQILMFSARGELDDRVQGLDSGADDYLVKPCEPKELLARVRSAMRIHELKRQLDHKAHQLQESVSKLEELARQREEFTAVLVHDIRSPLSTVLAALEITEMRAKKAGLFDADLQELYGHGVTTVKQIVSLVNEILDFSKAEAGAVALDLKVVSVAEFLENATSQIALAAKQKGVHVNRRVGADVTDLVMDSGKMLRAVANLLTNALKFTASGGHISVTAERTPGVGIDAGKSFTVIRIEDSGVGIPAKDLPYIFNPYYQAKQKTRQLGTGLGLAIVHRVVAAHGGAITVQSAEGVGTAFSLSFPS
jgi:two-component system, sensor histidine kinase and response regulator